MRCLASVVAAWFALPLTRRDVLLSRGRATIRGSWPAVLSSVGLMPGAAAAAQRRRRAAWGRRSLRPPSGPARVERGTILMLEGESPLAASFGFRAAGKARVPARSVEDVHAPQAAHRLGKAARDAAFDLPERRARFRAGALARRAADGRLPPRRGRGVVGGRAARASRAMSAFPTSCTRSTDLGLEPPFRSAPPVGVLRLVLPLARRSGLLRRALASGRHRRAARRRVAFLGARSAKRDEYLRHLIEACHRNGILVYAWLELPHVSEKFWDDHPEWREKTALLQDAQLDWRKLMNLTNRDCFRGRFAGRARPDRRASIGTA